MLTAKNGWVLPSGEVISCGHWGHRQAYLDWHNETNGRNVDWVDQDEVISDLRWIRVSYRYSQNEPNFEKPEVLGPDRCTKAQERALLSPKRARSPPHYRR